MSRTSSIALRRTSSIVVKFAIAAIFLPVLVLFAGFGRAVTGTRLRSGSSPRLIWGPVPIISIKYWSAALRERGYVSRTCVVGHYDIHQRSDYDLCYSDFSRWTLLQPYLAFLWTLVTADVFLTFFNGGFLRSTPTRGIELPLLRLAGKRIVVSPYGADIAVPGHLGVAEAPLVRDYPEIAARSDSTRRRVLNLIRAADLVVRNHQYGFLPRWDVLWPTQIAIDTDSWRPERPPGDEDGRAGEVVVVHAPNHRHIKGTEALIDAVAQLREEGLRIRLELLERRPNSEVLEALQSADIVADQFVIGYALFAIEGMAVGRPVLSALAPMASDVRLELERRGLPIVDTDERTVVERLRDLAGDPARRVKLGEAGRQFVLSNHSLAAAAAGWHAVVEHVWRGVPLPSELPR